MCSSLKDNLTIALYDISEERLNESYIVIDKLNKKYNDGSAIIEKYLGVDFSRAESALARNPRGLRALRLAEESFFRSRAWVEPLSEPRGLSRLFRRLLGRSCRPLPRLCERLSGHRFAFPQNRSPFCRTGIGFSSALTRERGRNTVSRPASTAIQAASSTCAASIIAYPPAPPSRPTRTATDS